MGRPFLWPAGIRQPILARLNVGFVAVKGKGMAVEQFGEPSRARAWQSENQDWASQIFRHKTARILGPNTCSTTVEPISRHSPDSRSIGRDLPFHQCGAQPNSIVVNSPLVVCG